MKIASLGGLLCCLVLVAAQADDTATATPQPLAITTGKAAPFEVVFKRTQASGIGGAAGGLIGIAIEEGIHAGADEKLTAQVKPKLSDPACMPTVLQALRETLAASSQLYTIVEPVDDAGSLQLVVHQCGLRLADSTDNALAAFVYVEVQLRPAGARKPTLTERIQVSGRERHAFQAYVDQAGLADRELLDVLRRAGSRAANKVIYSKP